MVFFHFLFMFQSQPGDTLYGENMFLYSLLFISNKAEPRYGSDWGFKE